MKVVTNTPYALLDDCIESLQAVYERHNAKPSDQVRCLASMLFSLVRGANTVGYVMSDNNQFIVGDYTAIKQKVLAEVEE